MEKVPVVLKPPRLPRRVAELEPLPSPESLLALGARVEKTPLYVGKWRGKGASTVRYVLELPYPKSVLFKGRPVSRLVLKVAPSGRTEVEEFHIEIRNICGRSFVREDHGCADHRAHRQDG